MGTVTEAGRLIAQGEDYDWQAGLINIANTTTAGAVGGTVFGATLNPALAATAAGGTYGGLNELMGCVGGIMGMGTAGYMAASGAPVLIQVAASGAAGGISSGATQRALTGQDTTPEAVAYALKTKVFSDTKSMKQGIYAFGSIKPTAPETAVFPDKGSFG